MTFYRYPKERWVHLWTSNPLESVFSGVRVRTDAARRMKRRDSALYLVFKIVERLSQRWRSLNGGANLMSLALDGCVFKDGILQCRGITRCRQPQTNNCQPRKDVPTTLDTSSFAVALTSKA